MLYFTIMKFKWKHWIVLDNWNFNNNAKWNSRISGDKAKSMSSIYIHHYIKIIIKAGNGDCIQCIYRKLIFPFTSTNSRKQTSFKHQLPILKGAETFKIFNCFKTILRRIYYFFLQILKLKYIRHTLQNNTINVSRRKIQLLEQNTKIVNAFKPKIQNYWIK